MRKLGTSLFAGFAALVLVVHAYAQTTNRVERPLYAGQHILIGKLVVEQFTVGSSKYLRVTYDTRGSNWYMTKTHLYVGSSAPKKAAPGQFPYKHSGLQNVQIDTYEIPLSTFGKSVCQLYIAAHADVCEMVAPSGPCGPDFEELSDWASQLTAVSYGYGGELAYFVVDAGVYGLFPGYCLDFYKRFPNIHRDPNVPWQDWRSDVFTVTMHPSYLPDGSINPNAELLLGEQGRLAGNLDLINFIVNQTYIFGSDPAVVPSATQLAIWYLTNGIRPEALLPPTGYEYLAGLAWQMISDALTYGQGFVPGPGQLAIVVAENVAAPQYQPVGLLVVVPEQECSPELVRCETAWAKGSIKFSTGWGSYFVYNLK